jgi:hypothetical protein
MIDAKITAEGALLTGNPEQIVRRNMRAAMHEAVQFGVRRVKGRTPQGVMGAQGGLLASIQGEVREPGGDVLGIIGTPSIYGLAIEKGRKPGGKMPPAGVMVRWIEVKMGVGEEEAKGIEFVIRRKIAKKGTDGAFMFQQTMEEDGPQFQNIFERYGIRITKELGRP